MGARFLINPADLAIAWPQISTLLDPVVKKAAKGEFTLADILELATDGRVFIGVVENEGVMTMACAFEFKLYPQMTVLNIMAIGGTNLRQVAALYFDTFRRWAKSAGADYIEASCSPAMSRILARNGFIETYRQVRRAT